MDIKDLGLIHWYIDVSIKRSEKMKHSSDEYLRQLAITQTLLNLRDDAIYESPNLITEYGSFYDVCQAAIKEVTKFLQKPEYDKNDNI